MSPSMSPGSAAASHLRLSWRSVPALLLLVLGSLILFQAAPARAEVVNYGGGQLDWGVRDSFRCYLSGPIAHGQAEALDGASLLAGTGSLCGGSAIRSGTEKLRFPVASGHYDTVSGDFSIVISGAVRFTGHQTGTAPPLLDTLVSDFRIMGNTASGTAAIVVDATGSQISDPGNVASFPDVEWVSFDATALDLLPGDEPAISSGVANTLTEAGEPVLSSYPAGDAFDPFELVLEAGTGDIEVPKPKITKMKPKYLSGGTTNVAKLTCPAAADRKCTVSVAKRLKVKTSGKLTKAARKQLRKGLRVKSVKRIAAGKKVKVQLKLTGAQGKKLVSKKLRGTLKIRVAVPGGPSVVKKIKIKAKVTPPGDGSPGRPSGK